MPNLNISWLSWFPSIIGIVLLLYVIYQVRREGDQKHLSSCLEGAFASDKDSLGKRIYWREHVWSLDGITKTDPYIELIFKVINAAVFPVVVIGIKGRFLIDGQECAQSAEIGGKIRIPHGESGNLRIKQHLSIMMASLLQEGVSKINLDSLQLIVQPEIGFETFGTSINNIIVGGEYEVRIPRP